MSPLAIRLQPERPVLLRVHVPEGMTATLHAAATPSPGPSLSIGPDGVVSVDVNTGQVEQGVVIDLRLTPAFGRGRGKATKKAGLTVYGNVGAIYDRSRFHHPRQEIKVSEFNQDNRGANLSGSAFGDSARVRNKKRGSAKKRPSATARELKAVLKAALEELAKEQLDEEDKKEVKETVETIEKEMAKPEPNKDRVTRWVEGVEKVSAVVGGLIRGAKAVAALFV
jgi:hypothetical protein